MLVLGIDPGLSRCGFALVESRKRGNGEIVSLGLLKTDKDVAIPSRLAQIKQDIQELLADYKPDCVAVERVFFQKNMNTATGVIQASGVIQAEAQSSGCLVDEYTPTDIKLSVAGDGAADKEQVQEMVKTLLSLAEVPKPADVADACAVALCHLAHNPKEVVDLSSSPTHSKAAT